jgi:hypothetical protein
MADAVGAVVVEFFEAADGQYGEGGSVHGSVGITNWGSGAKRWRLSAWSYAGLIRVSRADVREMITEGATWMPGSMTGCGAPCPYWASAQIPTASLPTSARTCSRSSSGAAVSA